MGRILKRPDISLPKPYKEAQKKVNSWFAQLEQKKDEDPFDIWYYEIPYLFLLTEEHLNLPDMTLEELKIVFPFYFDSFVYTHFWDRNHFSVGEIRKIIKLSQTKRIPLTLGTLFEQYRFARGSKRESLNHMLEELIRQEDPAVIDGYQSFLSEVGVLPGIDLEQWNIKSFPQLIDLWKQYESLNLAFWRYPSSHRNLVKGFQTYESEYVEIDWTIIEFLQTYGLEWEKRQMMSEEEEQMMILLRSFAKTRQWTREDVDKLSLLFEGDMGKTRDFLEKNRTGKDNLILDKAALHKVMNLAQCGRRELDRERNGNALTHFLKMAADYKNLHHKFTLDGFCYRVKEQDVEITMELELEPAPVHSESHIHKFCLKNLRIEHMTGPVEIIIFERNKEYHPIFSYENTWLPHNFQNYSKMVIKGDKELEISIPYIASVSASAFSNLPLKVLEVRGMVEKLKCNSESVEEIRVFTDITMEYKGFYGCKNLKKVIMPSYDRERFADHWDIPDVFEGCGKLVSIIGKENRNLLEIPIEWYEWEIRDMYEGQAVDRSSLIVQRDFLWWPKIIESGAEVLIYDGGDKDMDEMELLNEDRAFRQCNLISCENIKEIRIMEGLKVLGREFSKCHNLRKITLPKSLECLSYKAFDECPLLDKIKLPIYASIERDDGLKEGTGFKTDIFKKIIFPETHSFYRMEQSILYADLVWGSEKTIDIRWTKDDLEGKVIVPEGVNRICDLAFQNCKKMTEIVLPSSLNIIEKGAFAGCTALKKVVIKNYRLHIYDKDAYFTQEHYEEDEYSFRHSLFRLASDYIFGPEVELQYTDFPKGVLKIPEGTTYIPKYEYLDCKEITELILPKSLKSIGEYAFKGCDGIKKVMISGKEPWQYPEDVFGARIPKIEFINREQSHSLTYRPFAGIYDMLAPDEEE